MKLDGITIGILSGTLLLFAGVFLWGLTGKGGTAASVQGASAATTTTSVLAAPETFYDFGTISMKNGDVTKEFVVTNTTGEDVKIATVVTSCMCTKAFVVNPDGSVKGPFGMPSMGYVWPTDEIVREGESRIIRVVYDPNAHGPAGVGRIDRFVTLTDGAGGTMQFEIKALVTP